MNIVPILTNLGILSVPFFAAMLFPNPLTIGGFLLCAVGLIVASISDGGDNDGRPA